MATRPWHPGIDDWKLVCKEGRITVALDPQQDALWRTVTFGGDDEHKIREQVWPIWVPQEDSDSSASDFEKSSEDSASQARSTAKWVATILGAALAALIGSAPLSGIRDDYIPRAAYLCAGFGLAFLVFTIFLVIRVLIPQVTLFGDFFKDDHFKDLEEIIERSSGIMLPIGISTLAELGGRVRLEAITLNELARDAAEQSSPIGADLADSARTGRGKWLEYLSRQVDQWTAIASYDEVRQRVGFVRIGGLITGGIGTALIVLAFLIPGASGGGLVTYRVLPNDNMADAAQAQLGGSSCASFKGVIVNTDANSILTVLVEDSTTCPSATIMIPGKDLMPTP
jgi:hypothetical protein